MKTRLLYLTILIFTSFSYAQTTYVPDDNFEQVLIDYGYDDVLDDFVLTANINAVTGLGITNKGITDLTGIEDFTELILLNCEYNQLTNIDLSQNTNLLVLRCDNNQITGTLDLSQNIALIQIDCFQNSIDTLILPLTTTLSTLSAYSNNLTSLNVSQVTGLTKLYIEGNQISGTLDFTLHTALIDLFVGGNPLEGLILPSNSSIQVLACDYTQITAIDASQQSALEIISCINNPLLTALNVKNTNIHLGFYAYNNPLLTCIQVDDIDYSNTNWTNIDSHTSFSQDCSELSLGDFNKDSVRLFPNPVIDQLFLRFKIVENVTYQLMNLNGQILLEGYHTLQNNSIDLSKITSGVYFLKLRGVNQSIIIKIIKQ